MRRLLVLALVAACGGPPPATTPATPAPVAAADQVEQFGPAISWHDSSAEEVLSDVRRALAESNKLAPSSEAGVVLTEWMEHDGRRWPGAETRLRVEVTAERVIVYVQCRAGRDSCARTVPDHLDLLAVAKDVAHHVGGNVGVDGILRVFRTFRDQVCACSDKACIDAVEKQMMEWAMKNMDTLKEMKPTKAQDEAADRIEDEMDACKDKIDLATNPYTPPAHSYTSPVAQTPRPPGGTGVRECDEYLDAFDDMALHCTDKLGPALDAMMQARNAQVEAFAAWRTLDKKSKKASMDAAVAGCKAANDAIRQTALSLGCSI